VIDAMEFIGGVPELLVPDNPKALIAKADRYEPVLGNTTQDFGCCACSQRRALALPLFIGGRLMPAHRMSMRKLKELLRLKWACGLTHRQISRAIGISVGAISSYAARASAAGLDWLAVEPLADDELEARLNLSADDAAPARRIEPDYAAMHRELRRKGMTLQLLWEEYVEAHPGQRTYRYTQFCQRYKDWAKTLKRSMRQQHRAGEKLFADFAGPTIAVADGTRAHVFVAVLGASNYTYACATRSEAMPDWMNHYASAMLPARPRKPQLQ
jgi:transposase